MRLPSFLLLGRVRLLPVVLWIVLFVPWLGCSRDGGDTAAKEAEELAPEVPFTLQVDQKGVLYTYIEQDGSFHIAEKVADIPETSRAQVRIVLEGQPSGTPNHVFVANLERAQVGDTVSLSTLGRAAWEAHGLKYRQAKVAPFEEKNTGDEPGPAGVRAVIYGADWCGPCHQAEDYLKKKGIAVVKKDIEKDRPAAEEMRKKLLKAGIGGSSIPILDVGGTILVGFSPRAIDSALKRAAANAPPAP